MGKKEQLLKNLGSNMNESIGVRPAVHREPQVKEAVATSEKYAGRTRSRASGEMEIERIIPDPDQPRKQFDKDDLHRMAENVKKVGILQPIRVRWSDSHQKWMIISGERRYRSAKLAGLDSIPCIFVESSEESDLRIEQLVENCHRDDLKPIEQAKAFAALVELTGWSMQRLANELSFSKATVVRTLALLNLPSDVQGKVEDGDLSASSAYAISQVKGESQQRKLARQVVDKNLSRDATVALTKSTRPEMSHSPKKSVRQFATKNALVTVEHDKVNATEADVQESLLAAVKQLGRQSISGTTKRGGTEQSEEEG